MRYGDRFNELDLRVAKIFNYGRTRTSVGFDVYNALNAHPVTNYNQTFGPTWPLPTQIMPARFVKLSYEINF